MKGRRIGRLVRSITALVLIGFGTGPGTVRAQGPAGPANAIRVTADDVTTWVEADGRQVVVLTGQAAIDQGTNQIRSRLALLLVEYPKDPRFSDTVVKIAAEGDAAIQDAAGRRSAFLATTELKTREELNIQSRQTAIRRIVTKDDPFFRRATAALVAAAGPRNTPQPAAAVPTSGRDSVTLQPPQSGANAPGPAVQPVQLTAAPTAPQQPPVGPVLPPVAINAPGPARVLNVGPRTSAPFQVKTYQLPNGEQVVLATGGVLLTVRSGPGAGLIDIEADQLIFWTRGNAQDVFNQMRTSEGLQTQEQEFYLSGDVQIRSKDTDQDRTLRADQVYYDVRRNIAVAMNADLELKAKGIPDPLHLKAQEITQVAPGKFDAVRAEVFASRLPSDPGLKILLAKATVEDKVIERRTIFGDPVPDYVTGAPQAVRRRMVRGEEVVLEVEHLPIFYLPVVQGDANEPFGPLKNLGFRQDRIFGTQFFTTFNVWSLINRDPLPGTRWNLDIDYLSQRGPAVGTNYEYFGRDLFGLQGPFSGFVKAYGILDDGTDILGGGRGENDGHPEERGRLLFRHMQEMPNSFTVQAQVALLSDKNFLEQYYKPEFDTDLNQETFLYLKQQPGTYAWTALLKPNLRDWVTEDVWLPRFDGVALGQSPFGLFTYNVRGSAGYAELRPTQVPPPALLSTEQRDETGRFDVIQDLSLPFYAGPVKLVPYGVLDLTYYTDDLNGDSQGRVYGGGGLRASMPFSRLYPEVCSDPFNVNGIYHKVVFGTNYYIAGSSEPFTLFPELDRLNDDATDQALRDITPRQAALNPANGVALATAPIFNPQLYAIRRLVDNRVDTLDQIEVIQADIRQRWQTKRGFPGMQHIVDFVTLDLSGSFFPHPDRDNFGKNAAFLEYDTTWNIGDRTALVSSGLYDPFPDGTRVFTVGAYLNRPDRTSFFVGYRAIDPLESRAVTGAVTYIFSPKYAITASSTYDFGIDQALSNSVVISRIGSDLTLNLGLTYNAILNNVGFQLEILPNIVANSRARAGRPGALPAGPTFY